LTNGGGSSEEDRCRKLTAQLGVDIKPSQFIQAHTILKSVVKNYADVPVLVLGGRGGEIREVAEKYGFKKAYTTLDVLAWNPAVWPFHELTPDERQSTKPVDFSETPISAIFVFHDPRNWALDIQIICDVVQSGGMMCIPDEVTARKTRPVELVFCNPDIIWRSDFERPRIGQGAFREAFQAVYKALTGSEYPHVQYGKPTQATYRFAEKVLRDRCEEVQGRRIEQLSQRSQFIFNTIIADIAGANAAKWDSILVHTGVYDPRQGPPAHLPTQETEDVEAAVRWAIARERQKADAR
ncbi:hypothetical protein B0H21DRAFT_704254, partial [Amylocystis lapponica]